MKCFLLLITFSLSNGISFAASVIHSNNKIGTNTHETEQRKDYLSNVSELQTKSYLQISKDEIVLHPALSEDTTELKLSTSTYGKHASPLQSKKLLLRSIEKKTHKSNVNENMSIPKIKRSLPAETSKESQLRKSTPDIPFTESLNKNKIYFLKPVRENNSISNDVNNAEYPNDPIKFATFEVRENSNSTHDITLISTNKTQTADEIIAEIFGPFKKKYLSNVSKNEVECCTESIVSPSMNYTSQIHNLRETFECSISENDELKISCCNISLYQASMYIPSETALLDISESNERHLLKPLFPYLRNLTSLRLHGNHHKYITKAFTGLYNLKHLDLSHNNIQVLSKKLFTFTPNLKSLNLSMNAILMLRSITIAVSHLKYFENLTLDHNIGINRIFESDIQSLNNTRLKKFSLFNSTLNNIEQGAFKHLPFLTVLDLSNNYMGNEALLNVTSGVKGSALKYFGLQALVRLNTFPHESLVPLQNTSIFRLDLSFNYFTKLTNLPSIPSLKSLWLTQCNIENIDEGAFDKLPNLEELDLDSNGLFINPLTRTSLNNLKTFILSKQIFGRKNNFFLPSYVFQTTINLEILDMSNTLISNSLSRFTLHGLKKLRALNLLKTKLSKIEDYAFETLTSLKSLFLAGNELTYLTNFTFSGLENLTNLYLSNNLLHFSQSDNPFKSITFLKVLYLHSNNIVTLPKRIFGNLNNLETLMISNNNLLPWSTEILSRNSSLKILGLKENQINFITPVMLSEFGQVNKYLDLSRNPFNCSICGMDDFQQFLKSSNLTLGLPPPNNAEFSIPVCVEPSTLRGQPLLDVDLPLMTCMEMKIEVLSSVGLVLIVFSMLLITIMLYLSYYFRWYIRYWIFHVKAKARKTINLDNEKEQSYTYDAFVSYNSRDNYWIAQHLIPALEHEDPRYKLCVHERDFILGQLITENILESIEASRNVILVLTEDFIKSEWCMFELHMAQHKLFVDTRDCLILIKLKKLDKKLYTKNMMYLEKTRTCLTWSEDKTDQKLFWERIKKALGTPSSGSISKEIFV
ncbi:toll-like receptor 2 [Caerostris darwini]|uniref:Toll-like receptor 2 n=1 Tax=Caerostris darwini TaxID=1538125 RepID=A0AAV4R8Q6_9ARAC|nr:toll-like receptor 2 [Caerostris darwini]